MYATHCHTHALGILAKLEFFIAIFNIDFIPNPLTHELICLRKKIGEVYFINLVTRISIVSETFPYKNQSVNTKYKIQLGLQLCSCVLA